MNQTAQNRKDIAITCGDPAGIGPEIVLKSFKRLPLHLRKKILLFADRFFMEKIGRDLDINTTMTDENDRTGKSLRLHHLPKCGITKKEIGRVSAKTGRIAICSIDSALTAISKGTCCAIVTAPINKEAINMAGYRVAGHTEYFSAYDGGADVVMMMAGKKLKVALVTTHVAIKDLAKAITRQKVLKTLQIVDKSMSAYLGHRPKIAVCGFNPHAGDGGLFGNEENRIIIPAIESARRTGIDASGPYPADTLFTPKMREQYDVAIAIYHDQGLIPVKALSFGETVNVTLGLSFLRVSVDHGTACDIAGKGIADPAGMVYAIKTAERMLKGKL